MHSVTVSKGLRRRFLAPMLILFALGATLLPFTVACADPAGGVTPHAGPGASYLLSSNNSVVDVQNTGGFALQSRSAARVPEPATWGIFGMGMLLIAFGVNRRNRQRGTAKAL